MVSRYCHYFINANVIQECRGKIVEYGHTGRKSIQEHAPISESYYCSLICVCTFSLLPFGSKRSETGCKPKSRKFLGLTETV